MSLRIKLFLLPVLGIAAAAALVAVGSEQYARRQFQQTQQQRTETLVAQFQREIAQRGEEVVRTVQSVANSEATLRMALDLTRPQADPSIYANDARGLANLYHLDYLELDSADGTLISSSTWPPASGYRNDWVASGTDWQHQGAFLSRVQLPDKVELGLLAVRVVQVGDRNLYVVGGWRFDREFLQTVAVPDGMRTLLYANLEPGFVPEALTGPEGPVAQADPFAPLVQSLQRGENPQPRLIPSPDLTGGAERFVTEPLHGRGGQLLGALLVGSSQQSLATLVNYTRSLGFVAVGFGLLFSLALSWWASARLRHPLAQAVSAGAPRQSQSAKTVHPSETRPRGETAPTAAVHATGPVSPDGERRVQRERVAARREMARRFSRDLKESIFPLHMAAEDLLNAREETSERFDEIFFECTTAIRAELDRLKNIAARFGEFARMSRPRPVPVGVNEIAQAALKSIEPQFHAAGRPPVTPEVHLGEPEPVISSDPDLLRAALENLLLHCLDAMPSGGTLAVRTGEKNAMVHIDVSAQGAALSAEDCQRLFVPTGEAPEGMTGLGLATAHAVVNDHGGRIFAESKPGDGATIRLEFPATPAGRLRHTRTETAQQAPTETVRQVPTDAVRQVPTDAAPQALTESVHQPLAQLARPEWSELAQLERTEDTRSEHEEVAQPAPAPATPEPQAESLVAAETDAEPVLVTVVSQETTPESEEAARSAEAAAKPEEPPAPPAPENRPRAWLILDKNSLRL
jgi:signal transduction histidine kinase